MCSWPAAIALIFKLSVSSQYQSTYYHGQPWGKACTSPMRPCRQMPVSMAIWTGCLFASSGFLQFAQNRYGGSSTRQTNTCNKMRPPIIITAITWVWARITRPPFASTLRPTLPGLRANCYGVMATGMDTGNPLRLLHVSTSSHFWSSRPRARIVW